MNGCQLTLFDTIPAPPPVTAWARPAWLTPIPPRRITTLTTIGGYL